MSAPEHIPPETVPFEFESLLTEVLTELRTMILTHSSFDLKQHDPMSADEEHILKKREMARLVFASSKRIIAIYNGKKCKIDREKKYGPDKEVTIEPIRLRRDLEPDCKWWVDRQQLFERLESLSELQAECLQIMKEELTPNFDEEEEQPPHNEDHD